MSEELEFSYGDWLPIDGAWHYLVVHRTEGHTVVYVDGVRVVTASELAEPQEAT